MIVGHICADWYQIANICDSSISDSTNTENHKYLRFAMGIFTLRGNLLRLNGFFLRFASATHKQ